MSGVESTQRAELRFWMRTLFVPIAACGVLLGFLLLSFAVSESHPVSMAKLQRVQLGMSKPDVLENLGQPSIAEEQLWTYTSWAFCVVRIRFGADDRVEDIDHDH
jgi:hypothetical protein